jgi:hypothetical protein
VKEQPTRKQTLIILKSNKINLSYYNPTGVLRENQYYLKFDCNRNKCVCKINLDENIYTAEIYVGGLHIIEKIKGGSNNEISIDNRVRISVVGNYDKIFINDVETTEYFAKIGERIIIKAISSIDYYPTYVKLTANTPRVIYLPDPIPTTEQGFKIKFYKDGQEVWYLNRNQKYYAQLIALVPGNCPVQIYKDNNLIIDDNVTYGAWIFETSVKAIKDGSFRAIICGEEYTKNYYISLGKYKIDEATLNINICKNNDCYPIEDHNFSYEPLEGIPYTLKIFIK